jgi:hypothetical protein
MESTSSVLDGVLELLSFALVSLDRPDQAGAARLIVDRLDALADIAATDAVPLRLRVLAHRMDMAYRTGLFDDMARFAQEAMSLAGPGHQDYYLAAACAAKSLLHKGDATAGFEALGKAVAAGVLRSVDRAWIRDLLQTAAQGDVRSAPPAFRAALAQYAVRYVDLSGQDFHELWARDPAGFLNDLIADRWSNHGRL